MLQRPVIQPVQHAPVPVAAQTPHARTLLARTKTTAAHATSRLDRSELAALGYWLLAHLALAATAWMSSWIGGRRGLYRPLLGIYGQWDYVWFHGIAAHGYFSGRGDGPGSFAFLPGYPLVLAAVHLIVRDWVAAGLLVNLVAGGFAVLALVRLGGDRAPVYLLTAPAAMYLMVGYSETLFLALALHAWLASRRRNWPLAALLAALAGTVRPNGLFLIAALLLAAALSERGRRLRSCAWAALAALGPLLVEVYFWTGTRSWTAWASANALWALHFVGPWRSLDNTWQRAFGTGMAPDLAAMYQVEIACMVAALALTAVLLRRRAWPEALYCALAVFTLGTSTYYQAVPRALLVMWPLYVLVAQSARRRAWVGQVYLWMCAPLAVLTAVYFFLGKWAM